jgi:hypothetical protein
VTVDVFAMVLVGAVAGLGLGIGFGAIYRVVVLPGEGD